MSAQPPIGALLVDKPSGISSAKAVARVKRNLPRKTRVGHTGTLDPMASGLLVMLLGRATRLSRYVTDLDKEYLATATLGASSDTGDAEGKISTLNSPLPSRKDLEAAVPDFTGEILQTPPMASAVKVGGERLYRLHRRGLSVERNARSVTVYSLQILSITDHAATLRISCSAGTYIRTLVSDLARSTGSDAYLTSLTRTRVGRFSLQNAIPTEELTSGLINRRIIPANEVVSHLPVVEVSEAERGRVCNGGGIEFEGEGLVRVECCGELLGVYSGEEGHARPEVVLCGG